MWIIVVPYAGFLGILAYFTSEQFEWDYVSIMAVVTIVQWAIFLLCTQYFVDSMVAVSNSVRPQEQWMECKLNLFKLAVGLSLHSFLMPIAIVVIMLSKYIVWSGVRYYKRAGKIWKVERTDEEGNMLTKLASASIAKTLRDPRFKQLLTGRDPVDFEPTET
jgi:hypothetical protein